MAIHPVFVHFHTGILTANAAIALLNLIMRTVFRDRIRTPGTTMARLFHEFDAFLLWGNIIGLLGLFAGVITGFMDWPMQALLDNPYMRFKILWSAISTEVFIFLVAIRLKLGDRVWANTSSYLIYGIMTVIGGVMMILLGAMGGIAVYGDSILKPLLDWIGLPWP